MFYSVQFLRGVAALMVVLTHVAHKGQQYGTGALSGFHIGGDGVDLFFIISGFIMCVTTHDKRTTLSGFLINRLKRIIPLYWVLSFAALAIFIVDPKMVNSSGGETGIFQSFFLIPSGVKFLIQNGWTLSYEFYYYLIFSVFIFLTDARLVRYLGVSASILALAVLGEVVNSTQPFLAFLLSDMLLEFMLGVIAFIVLRKNKPGHSLAMVMVLMGVAWQVYKNSVGTPTMPFGKTFTSGVPMFLIFLGLLSLESWFTKSKGWWVRTFEQLGNASYSLYLIHPFILSPAALILKNLGLMNPVMFTATLVSGSIIAGFATYFFIEKPLSHLTRNIGKGFAAKNVSSNTPG